MVALLSGGHVLLEGHPGTGKTLLARSFAEAIGGEFKRIQLMADMLPGDITGFKLYQSEGDSKFIPGPIFANVVLADELNRTTPRTQAAFLEAMQEGQVTVEGVSYPLPYPFLAIATQVPSISEGSYQLPEGELDRFAFRIWNGYLDRSSESEVLRIVDDLDNPKVTQICTPQEIIHLREIVKTIEVSELVVSYIMDLIESLRNNTDVLSGPSSRGALTLLRASRAHAFLEGRDFVIPDDVKGLTIHTLQHRLRLTAEAEIEGIRPIELVEATLERTPVPKGES